MVISSGWVLLNRFYMKSLLWEKFNFALSSQVSMPLVESKREKHSFFLFNKLIHPSKQRKSIQYYQNLGTENYLDLPPESNQFSLKFSCSPPGKNNL